MLSSKLVAGLVSGAAFSDLVKIMSGGFAPFNGLSIIGIVCSELVEPPESSFFQYVCKENPDVLCMHFTCLFALTISSPSTTFCPYYLDEKKLGNFGPQTLYIHTMIAKNKINTQCDYVRHWELSTKRLLEITISASDVLCIEAGFYQIQSQYRIC